MVSRRFGCPARTICSSFDFSVSKFDKRRISSRACGVRFCASSTTRSDALPCVRCWTRKSASSRSSIGFDLPFGSKPKSIAIASSSSRGSRIVLTSRATTARSSSRRSSVCNTVVLPAPISPVTTMNPTRFSMPKRMAFKRFAMHPAQIQVTPGQDSARTAAHADCKNARTSPFLPLASTRRSTPVFAQHFATCRDNDSGRLR